MNKVEVEQFIDLTKKVGDVMPAEVFEAVANKFVLTAIEMLVFKEVADNLYILLTQRDKNDIHWPNMWHNPGTVIRSSDFEANLNPYNKAFRRLENEIGGEIQGDGQLLTIILGKSERGVSNLHLYEFKLKSEPKIGKFFDINALPANAVHGQKTLIETALKYRKNLGR